MESTLEASRGQYVELTWAPAHAGARKSERSPRRYRAWIPETVGDFEPLLQAATAALCERAGAELRQLNSEPGRPARGAR